jgi:hypothetical protein
MARGSTDSTQCWQPRVHVAEPTQTLQKSNLNQFPAVTTRTIEA